MSSICRDTRAPPSWLPGATLAAAHPGSTPRGPCWTTGFRAIIAPSFAEIFHKNCFDNGIVPVHLPEDQVHAIMIRAKEEPGYRLEVDLETCRLTGEDGFSVPFVVHNDPEIHEFRRHCLLNGLDDIALTLQHEDKNRGLRGPPRAQAGAIAHRASAGALPSLSLPAYSQHMLVMPTELEYHSHPAHGEPVEPYERGMGRAPAPSCPRTRASRGGAGAASPAPQGWIPACAGMTVDGCSRSRPSRSSV